MGLEAGGWGTEPPASSPFPMLLVALVSPPSDPAIAAAFCGNLLGDGWEVQGFGSQDDVPDDVAKEMEFVVAPPPVEPPVPEWDLDQLLMYEKEVLGFYLSGHPLKRVWAEAQRVGAIGTADLQSREDGSRVVLCGLVSAMREINTKNGDRMAFATLEDMDGAVELTIFPETFRQSAAHLKGGAPLLVRGKVEGSAAARKLLAEDIRPLGEVEVGGPSPSACRIRVGGAVGAEALRALRAICDEHGGPVPVYIHVHIDGSEVVVRSRAVAVKPSPAFVAAVEGLLGSRAVRLE